jgi:DNA-binding MarR family transcriptional regulator
MPHDELNREQVVRSLLAFVVGGERLNRAVLAFNDLDLRPTNTIAATMLLLGDEPLRPSDLASLVGVKPSAMSKALSHLEKAGLIERQELPADRRALLVSITPAGLAWTEALVSSVAPIIGDVTEAICSHRTNEAGDAP